MYWTLNFYYSHLNHVTSYGSVKQAHLDTWKSGAYYYHLGLDWTSLHLAGWTRGFLFALSNHSLGEDSYDFVRPPLKFHKQNYVQGFEASGNS